MIQLRHAGLVDSLDGSAAPAAKLLGEVGRGRSQDPGGTVRAMMRRLGVTPKR